MSRRRQKRQTWLREAVRRGGVKKGTQVMAFVITWADTTAELGHEPTVEEYAVTWKVSSRTVYRELAAFREVWPEFTDPSGMVDMMQRQAKDVISPLLPMPNGLRDV